MAVYYGLRSCRFRRPWEGVGVYSSGPGIVLNSHTCVLTSKSRLTNSTRWHIYPSPNRRIPGGCSYVSALLKRFQSAVYCPYFKWIGYFIEISPFVSTFMQPYNPFNWGSESEFFNWYTGLWLWKFTRTKINPLKPLVSFRTGEFFLMLSSAKYWACQ